MSAVASGRIARAAVLRVLRTALDVAAADPRWRGGPAEYDYLSAEQIAELVGMDRDWRTLGYETPAPASVLRQLRGLERDELVWTWDAGPRSTAATTRCRFALIPDALRGRGTVAA